MSTTKALLTGVITLAIISSSFHIASAEALNADTKKSERKYRKTKTGEGALTQKMLEACIELKSETNKEFEKISASKEEFDTLSKEVSDLRSSLKENEENLTDKDEGAVNEHNEQVEHYNKRVEELKEMEETYNSKSGPYQEKVTQLEKNCDGQPYYEDDYAAAVKKTGKSL